MQSMYEFNAEMQEVVKYRDSWCGISCTDLQHAKMEVRISW